MLVQKGFESDPVAAWTKAQEKALEEDDRDGNDSDGSVDSVSLSGPNFNYILNMPLWCLSKEKVDELLRQRDIKKGELNELQRKSPEDLWKEDLAVFIEELDKIEAQEQADMSAGRGTKLVKGKVGKPKVKKLHLEETLPSLYGRRVVPTITQAMKTDASKKMTKKKKGDADLVMKLEFDDEMGVLGSDGGTGENSLNSSSNTPATTPAKPKAPRVKQEKKEPGTPRARKPPTPKGSSGKKVKKRNPWSEDESKSESDLEDSEPVVIPRDTKSQRASATKPKYTFDFSEEEYGGEEEDDDDDDAASLPARPCKDDFTASSETKDRYNDHSNDDEDIFPSPKQTTTTVSPAKKKKEPESIFSSSKSACSSEKSNDSDDLKLDSDGDDKAFSYSSSSAFDKPVPAKKGNTQSQICIYSLATLNRRTFVYLH
ncbi:unnamed protein product [Oncorhynchus mykiss]|uniref:DNA topoisomerase type IIA domain-containing protein n=1 Tax=Oncorhynchus mykiss TaxID=8022 RepID=A0A060YUE3_ONCMY|nr:unnamed protein product [Oncorhynchus mykiss]